MNVKIERPFRADPFCDPIPTDIETAVGVDQFRSRQGSEPGAQIGRTVWIDRQKHPVAPPGEGLRRDQPEAGTGMGDKSDRHRFRTRSLRRS